MEEQFSRTALITGGDGVERLRSSYVAVFGIGGVGSYAAEALARAGIGRLKLVDGDVVEESNINRQLAALHSTVGMYKAEVMAARVRDISPHCRAEADTRYFTPETEDEFRLEGCDYMVDAIDMVTGKIALAERAVREGIPIISSMGTGNKLDPSGFKVALIEDTRVCPLARVMRRELKKRGIEGIKAVYSEEEPVKAGRTPGSISFVPSVAGLIMAGEVIRDILKSKP